MNYYYSTFRKKKTCSSDIYQAERILGQNFEKAEAIEVKNFERSRRRAYFG